MQIQLKQPEIEAALKQFIAQQGINLTGKTVAIEFTSGRKDNGLSAEITIEDINAERRTATTNPMPAETGTAMPEQSTAAIGSFMPAVTDGPASDAPTAAARVTSLFSN